MKGPNALNNLNQVKFSSRPSREITSSNILDDLQGGWSQYSYCTFDRLNFKRANFFLILKLVLNSRQMSSLLEMQCRT
jgi:hypothetical protein